MNFSAVILAGGKSSRMGRDKAFLDIDGDTLLARQIRLARQAGADEVFISGRADVDYSPYGSTVLLDLFPDAGPLAGIERALDTITSPLLLVVAVDLPKLNATFLRALAAGCSDRLGAVPRIGGQIEPLVSFYPKTAGSFANALLREDRNAVGTFAKACAESGLVHFYEVTAGEIQYFTNWNHPAEIAPATSSTEPS